MPRVGRYGVLRANTASSVGSARPKIFYGWWVVLAAATGLFFGYAPIFVFSFGVFLKPLSREFDSSRTSISLAFAAANLMQCVGSPLTGMLVDRWGPRRVILVATTLFACLLISVMFFSSSLGRLYALFLAMGFIGTGTAPVPYGKAISNWFDRRRGLALGFTMIGIGLGAIVMPPILERLMLSVGWRGTYAILGCAVLSVPISVIVLFLKNSPEQIGLFPDGAKGSVGQRKSSSEEDGCTSGEAWRSSTFWAMAGSFFLVGMSVTACVIHLMPMLTDRGISPGTAALASSVLGLALLAGRLSSGYLLDRLFAPFVAACFFAAAGFGMLLLSNGIGGKVAFIAVLLVGLGMGAEVDVIAYLTSRYFGLRSFGEIYGYLFAIYTLSGALGPLIMAEGFDHSGSYRAPLLFFFIATIAAVWLILRLGSYRYFPFAMANYRVEAAPQ
jgi:MFS family permease